MIALALDDLNPSPDMATMPFLEWATVIWEKAADVKTLEAAWLRTASISLASTESIWPAVTGPAGAVRAMMRENSGWRWPSWHTLVTPFRSSSWT